MPYIVYFYDRNYYIKYEEESCNNDRKHPPHGRVGFSGIIFINVNHEFII